MSDYNSSLPIRSEGDADEKVQVRILDGLDPSKMASVDSDKNLHVEIHGNDPAGVDRVVRVSEAGALTPDGVYDAASNTKPGSVGLIASARNAAPGDATQGQRLTAATNGNKRLLDVSMHDENGDAFSASNPLPVTLVDSEGAEINSYATTSALAAGASANHDYTVTAATTLKLSQLYAAGSGKIKVEVQVETAAASGVFNTKFVQFNSTSAPNVVMPVIEAVSVPAGAKVRVKITNRDLQAQDVYSTICGHEI